MSLRVFPTYVFKTPAGRVQIVVFDLSAAPPPWNDATATFSVRTLPASAHRSAAFTTGTREYWGTSFDNAWAIVQRLVRATIKVPVALRKYIGKESP